MAPERSPKKYSKPKATKKSSSKAPPTSFKSPENISDSDDTDSSSADDSDAAPAPTAKPTPVKKTKVTSVNATDGAKKRKIDVAQGAQLPQTNGRAESTSDEEDEDEQSESEEQEEQDVDMKDADSTEDSSEDEDEDSESESDEGIPLATPEKTTSKTRPEIKSRQTAVSSAAIDDWSPPDGYTRLKLNPSHRLLRPSALKGKQLWHISIPEGLEGSLSEIKTILPGSMSRGVPVLTGPDGGSYTFHEKRKRETEGVKVLAPDEESNEYMQIALPISRTLDLQHMMDSAEEKHKQGAEGDLVGPDPKLLVAQRTYEKDKPPEQVQDLRMMNVPIGVVEDEEVVEKRVFKKPRKLAEVATNGVSEGKKGNAREEETPEERAQRKAEKAKRKAAKEQRRLAKASAR